MKKGKNLNIWLAMSMFLLLMVSIATGEIIFVDVDATGNNDGTSWADAYNYLQDALAVSSSGDEIQVAQGIYKPDEDSAHPNGTGDREATFQLINGVALKGGYAGAGEPEPNARDVEAYETILSGDLAGDDGPDFANNGENCYHVTVGSNTDPNTVLDGFTITAGTTDSSLHSYPKNVGGGMYNNSGSPTLIDCTFTGNSNGAGAGMYNTGGEPMLLNCAFIRNSANKSGGGIYSYGPNADMTLTGCTFNGNSAGSLGGGMYNHGADPTLTNCMFIGNSAKYGGGMCSEYNCSPILTNCTFIDNSAVWCGGGMFSYGTGPIVSNCTFIGNSAERGGGIDDRTAGGDINMLLTNSTFIGNEASYCGGGLRYEHCSPTVANCTFVDNSADAYGGGICGEFAAWPDHAVVVNCILWANNAGEGPQIALLAPDRMAVSYCCLQGGRVDIYVEEGATLIWNDSSIDADPCFADADNDDYHLLSQAGRWNPDASSWFIDAATSPCIDAGDPVSDWTAELWPHGKCINMGAFGGTPQASMSELPAGNIADLDANDVVNYADLKLFTDGWLRQQVLLSEDLDRDGVVNFKDFAIFANEWLWEE